MFLIGFMCRLAVRGEKSKQRSLECIVELQVGFPCMLFL